MSQPCELYLLNQWLQVLPATVVRYRSSFDSTGTRRWIALIGPEQKPGGPIYLEGTDIYLTRVEAAAAAMEQAYEQLQRATTRFSMTMKQLNELLAEAPHATS